jgi:hypothetical protein
MAHRKHDNNQRPFDRLITILLGLSWLEVLVDAWKAARKLLQSRSYKGMYEVLEYESTLELKDRGGKRAAFKKREKVRYLQDNVIAYQDQAWGDGEILINYRCTPGTPVDRYRSGYKTHILISRREVKNKGDGDETHVIHRMKHLKIGVIFPKSRPPQHARLIESNRQRSHSLERSTLPGGRWLVAWETRHPRLYENYILQWEW